MDKSADTPNCSTQELQKDDDQTPASIASPQAPWVRPPFRWAGSKRQLIPLLMRAAPSQFRTYVEPFAGSASLFFALNPSKAVIGDFNADLMHAYGVLADRPRALAQGLHKLPVNPSTYYSLRSVDPKTLDDLSRAIRFVYLNRHCYNGVYRTNRKAEFNVPMGTRVGRLPSELEFVRCSRVLRKATLVADDFRVTLASASAGDFAYVDPPYYASHRANHGEYGYGAFSPDQISDLIEHVEAAAQRGTSVLLSYKNDLQIVEQLGGWSIVNLSVRRQVGCGPSRLSDENEILAANSGDLSKLIDHLRPQIGKNRRGA